MIASATNNNGDGDKGCDGDANSAFTMQQFRDYGDGNDDDLKKSNYEKWNRI